VDFNGYGRVLRSQLIIIAALCLATPAWADDEPSYDRPGYGFAPSALGRGGFAYEQGLPTWTLGHDDGVRSSQYTTDSLLRIGLGANLELQLGSSPFNRLSQRGQGVSQVSYGHGDSSLGLKLGLPSSDPNWSWAMLGTVEFTDGAHDIRNDRRQYTLGLAVQQQVDDKQQWSYFAQAQQMGGQSNFIAAADYNYAITKAWGVYGEIAGLHGDGQNGMQIGNGLTWLPNPRLQFDISWRRRIAGHANDWEGGLGVAIYFGR
jgi:hypothetical protein